MSLAGILRNGVKTIDKITGGAAGGMQASVTIKYWTDEDSHGAATYGKTLKTTAIVDQTIMLRRASNGEMIMTKASVIFPRELKPIGGTRRQAEPIDPRDVIILPDGTTGTIVSAGAPVAGETSKPYFSEVLLA